MMQFQNTIAYGTIFDEGGVVTNLVGGSFVPVMFLGSVLQGSEIKNINVLGDGTSQPFGFQVTQDGDFWIDISFVAFKGDSKNYAIRPVVTSGDGSVVTNMDNLRIDFLQQSNDQHYEVSNTFILGLNRHDKGNFEIFVQALSTEDFSIQYLKMSTFNLQQLGLH